MQTISTLCHRCYLHLGLLLLLLPVESFSPSAFDVEWLSPSAGPGKTLGGLPTYADAMPLGNGALTALAWANATSGGVGIYLGHQGAQSSHTELYKLGLLQLSVSPNPFSQGAYFSQRLDVAAATVRVAMGGTAAAPAVAISVWVDACSDALYVDVVATSPVRVAVAASSTRPAAPWNHTLEFGFCGPVTSLPDVFVDPLPPPVVLSRAPPQTARDTMRHASGARRPLRRAPPPAGAAAFAPASLISFHRNSDAEGLTVNATLTQQGVPQLVGTTPDWWRDLQSGFVLEGVAGALARVDARTLDTAAPGLAFSLRATVLAVQTDTEAEWLEDLAALVARAPGEGAARQCHGTWWNGFWARSWVAVNGSARGGQQLSSAYQLTRYVQAVQSRGTIWPIKFNGGAFIAAMGGDGEADKRGWGPSNWWQNTRLPYGTMLAAGDFEQFEVLLDYLLNQLVFLNQRTLAYFNHSGFWTTETTHLTGAYDAGDYGCGASRAGYPDWLAVSGFIHVDQGGDSGMPEMALMALDYVLALNASQASLKALPLALAVADYYAQHFAVNASSGRVVIAPTQVLESFWCTWNSNSQKFVDCCADDTPTVSGMGAVFEKLLALPLGVLSPARRAAYAAFAPRIPELPLSTGLNGTVIAPGRVLSDRRHNHEGPEHYPIHPHRLFTMGRAVAAGQDLALARRTWESTFKPGGFSHSNTGWNYGVNTAALLGLTQPAAAQVLERAATPPAPGYRFPGFAPHFQDFDPSADFFANMNRALQDMLLQGGEDGWGNATLVLFPTWPCDWDVSAKLWAPQNTSVEIEYAGGALQRLTVTPSTRAASVKWAACVTAV